MSLRDLFKDKPPIVSTSSNIPWPPPEKNISASSTSSHNTPFLTSSPLYSFKRRPTLREFLNPNYRQKIRANDNDELSEPSVLLSSLKNTGLNKADLDLCTSRSKVSKPAVKTSKVPRKSLEKQQVKALSSDSAGCSSDTHDIQPRVLELSESKTLTGGQAKACDTPLNPPSSQLPTNACNLTSAKTRARTANTVDTTSKIIADVIISVVKGQGKLSSRKQLAETMEDTRSGSLIISNKALSADDALNLRKQPDTTTGNRSSHLDPKMSVEASVSVVKDLSSIKQPTCTDTTGNRSSHLDPKMSVEASVSVVKDLSSIKQLTCTDTIGNTSSYLDPKMSVEASVSVVKDLSSRKQPASDGEDASSYLDPKMSVEASVSVVKDLSSRKQPASDGEDASSGSVMDADPVTLKRQRDTNENKNTDTEIVRDSQTSNLEDLTSQQHDDHRSPKVILSEQALSVTPWVLKSQETTLHDDICEHKILETNSDLASTTVEDLTSRKDEHTCIIEDQHFSSEAIITDSSTSVIEDFSSRKDDHSIENQYLGTDAISDSSTSIIEDFSSRKQQINTTKDVNLCAERMDDSIPHWSSKEQCSDAVIKDRSLVSRTKVVASQTSIIEQEKLSYEKQLSNPTKKKHIAGMTAQPEETVPTNTVCNSNKDSSASEILDNAVIVDKGSECVNSINQIDNIKSETGIPMAIDAGSDPGKVKVVKESGSSSSLKRTFDQMEEDVIEMECKQSSPVKTLLMSFHDQAPDSTCTSASSTDLKVTNKTMQIHVIKSPPRDAELMKKKSVKFTLDKDDVLENTGEMSDKHSDYIRSYRDLKSTESDVVMESYDIIPDQKDRNDDTSKGSTTACSYNVCCVSDVPVGHNDDDDNDENVIDDGDDNGDDDGNDGGGGANSDDSDNDDGDDDVGGDADDDDDDSGDDNDGNDGGGDADGDGGDDDVHIINDDLSESYNSSNEDLDVQNNNPIPTPNDNHDSDHDSVEVLVFKDYDDDDEIEDGEIESDDDQLTETLVQDSPSESDLIRLEDDPKEMNQPAGKKKWKRKRKRKGKQKGQIIQTTSFPKNKTLSRKSHTQAGTHPKTAKPVDVKNPVAIDSKAGVEKINSQQESEQHEGFSLLSCLTNSAVDITVAASEKELLIKKKTRGGKVSARKKKKLQRRMNTYYMKRKAQERREVKQQESIPLPVCTFYLKGVCRKGAECPFRHEGTPTKIQEVCKFYVMDACRKEDDCPFLHHTFPCKFHHSDSTFCHYGNDCKFSHDALTSETKAMLDRFLAEYGRGSEPLLSHNPEYSVIHDKGHDSNTKPSNTANSPGKYSLRSRTIPKTPIISVRYGLLSEEDTPQGTDMPKGTDTPQGTDMPKGTDTPKGSLKEASITKAGEDMSSSKQEASESPNTINSVHKYGLRNRSVAKTPIYSVRYGPVTE